MTCDTLFRCRETPHSDVLNQNTVSPTIVMSQDIGNRRTCNCWSGGGYFRGLRVGPLGLRSVRQPAIHSVDAHIRAQGQLQVKFHNGIELPVRYSLVLLDHMRHARCIELNTDSRLDPFA